MTDRPILMQAAMVLQLRGGHKTQTRRELAPGMFKVFPADRLYVRETFYFRPEDGQIGYTADLGQRDIKALKLRKVKFGPAIHMNRQFSRITLHVHSVAVQRLQEIDEPSARAEGFSDGIAGFRRFWRDHYTRQTWEQNPQVMVIGFQAEMRNIDDATEGGEGTERWVKSSGL